MREHPSGRVDVRSDTITQPVPAMRTVMERAEVGDDVLGDDPTVIELQNRVAKLFGKEAGLFVASGTMSNAIALRAHTVPGDEIICDKSAHIYRYEGGGYAALCGASIALVDGEKSIMSAQQVQVAIRKSAGSQSHYPNGKLVCVENTANLGGGGCYPQSVLDEIAIIAHNNDCKAHVDGARIFNAVIATGTDPARICRDYDSVSICFSKGLGAPVGSVLVGSNEFIANAHRWRKMFGGGWRQAGMLAAACLYALDHHIDRLAEDHRRAKFLGDEIDQMEKFKVDLSTVQTNMVYVDCTMDATKLVQSLSALGIDLFDTGPNTVRIVTHLHITDEDVKRIIAAFAAQ
ncbi:MAG TPA: low specificity L-threonine aldolase [Candidatus Poseidoniales archaeon]|jgi:threonine aldolase|nr:low specificity L-threonine aldolase [Candidatus Poseidoniales archaeon]